MGVSTALAGAWARTRRGALALLALLLAVGLAVALVALESARRTERAYPDFLRQHEVGDLVVNLSFPTARERDIVASTPGVLSFARDSTLTVTADAGQPRTVAKVAGGELQARSSDDGRYVRQDRPVIHAGRMVRGGDEAFISVQTARRLSLHVGDRFPLTFWDTGTTLTGDPHRTISPIGTATVRVVGIGVFADEVLVDELYPRERIVITPDVAAPFDCSFHQPDAGDQRPVEELVATVIPARCALSYRYYSLRVSGGAAGVAEVSRAIGQRATEENARLPPALRSANVGYSLIPAVTADEERRLHQSLAPSVTALRLFGAAAALATLVVFLLAALRAARQQNAEVRIWRELGARRRDRLFGLALPLGAAALVGVLASVPLAWFASAVGPVASARTIEPGAHRGLGAALAVEVLGAALLLMLIGVVGLSAAASSGVMQRAVRPLPMWRRSFGGRSSPAAALGVHSAFDGAGARTLLVASVAAVTAVLSTLTFGTSLSDLARQPKQFGWTYDVGVMVGFGYGGAQRDAITASLDRPEVSSWGLAAMAGGFGIDGQTVAAVADDGSFFTHAVPVVSGRLPAGADEIALGALTARHLHLHLGDATVVTSSYGQVRAKVTGIVVLPPLGPVESDRAALGTGMLLSRPLLRAIVADAERQAGAPAGSFADGAASFVGIDLKDGVDPHTFVALLRSDLSGWDETGEDPFVYERPVRPALIADVASMRTVPTLLGATFALTMAAALALGIAVGTRARRRELALLRAMGCTRRQVRASVRWHALTVLGVGTIAGVPLGIALGRSLYASFANSIGVAPHAHVSALWTAGVIGATVLVGLLAAAAPGRIESGRRIASVLRGE